MTDWQHRPTPAGAYVYRYAAIADGNLVPIYVGKGRGRRGWSHLVAALRKARCGGAFHGALRLAWQAGILRLDILAEGLTDEAALAEEERLIAAQGQRCIGTGPLYNIAKGGRNGVTSEIALRAAATRAPYWSEVAKKAALTRRRRAAAKKAAATRAPYWSAVALKAAETRRRNAAANSGD
jgi:hypothetical protein